MMDFGIGDIQFERQGPIKKALKTFVINPLANYTPSGISRALLKFGKSELASANWKDPGGWRSMVISYNGKPRQIADRILVSAGTVPMALRNRRKLAGRVLARLIESCQADSVQVLCLGAGPGHIIADALCQAVKDASATLVDLSSDAFDYGTDLARQMGLSGRVRFVIADARNAGDINKVLQQPPHIVKMIGLCEYLSDEQIVSIAKALSAVMPKGSSIVSNSLSPSHGTDRFFRRVFGLNMNYRTAEQLQALLASEGFGDFQTLPEPLGVYQVIVGRRI
jgi:predicted RNA methylase